MGHPLPPSADQPAGAAGDMGSSDAYEYLAAGYPIATGLMLSGSPVALTGDRLFPTAKIQHIYLSRSFSRFEPTCFRVKETRWRSAKTSAI